MKSPFAFTIEGVEPVELETPFVAEEEKKESTEEKVETENVDTTVVEDDESPYELLAKSFIEKGILQPDDEKEYEDSEEGFKELIEDTIQNLFASKLEVNPELLKLWEIAERGGEIERYVELKGEDYENVDLEDVDNQILLIQETLENKGVSEKIIQSTIESLEESPEQLREQAYIAIQELIELRNERLNNYEQELIESRQQQEFEDAKELENIRQAIFNKDKIAEFELTPELKTDFYNYLTEPVKEGKTRYEIDNEKLDDKLITAYMSYVKYNKNDIERKATTLTSEKLRSALNKITDPNAKGKTEQNERQVIVTDDLSGLRGFKL